MNGAFRTPRSGRNNDQAHPPIHPVNYAAPGANLNPTEHRLYEFVVRRFLACCSDDAKGQSTTVNLLYGIETFSASGLLVLERNYLDVYPYDKWESSQQLPNYEEGETFEPDRAEMVEGKTSPPTYMTEPELIALMDANGIGTDATMAEHIKTIKERGYVKLYKTARSAATAATEDEEHSNEGTGTGRGRGGRGRGRGGRGTNAAASGGRGGGRGPVEYFIPSTLGVALVEGYDRVGIDVSLSKPFLRKEMELQMKDICVGSKTRYEVVQQSIEQYRQMFTLTQRQISVLKQSVQRYVLESEQQQG
jgi:DNA topoisomerase III